MVLDSIPQPLPVHFFGSRPQPPTSRSRAIQHPKQTFIVCRTGGQEQSHTTPKTSLLCVYTRLFCVYTRLKNRRLTRPLKRDLKGGPSKETESEVCNTGVQQSHKTQKRDLKQETLKKRPWTRDLKQETLKKRPYKRDLKKETWKKRLRV